VSGNHWGVQVGLYNLAMKLAGGLQVGGNNVVQRDVVGAGFQVAVISNTNGGNLNGDQIALLWNNSRGKGEMTGFQFALISNDSDSKVLNGVQLSLILNDTDGIMNGAQIALVSNNADSDVNGTQLSIFSNHTDGSLAGAQLALLQNIADRNMTGVQLAVGLNLAAGANRFIESRNLPYDSGYKVSGWQGSIFVNQAYGPFHGVQSSVFYNTIGGRAENSGAQLGIFNRL